MNRFYLKFLSLVSLVAFSVAANAAPKSAISDGSFLDPAYKHHRHPVVVHGLSGKPKSNTTSMIEKITAVRAQAARGTCSIFSATAYIEAILALSGRENPASLNLSEEYLEYLATRNQSDDGSTSDRNFRLISTYGMTTEALLPYIGETWETLEYSALSKEGCGRISGDLQKSCLIAHRDPRLLKATDAALLDPKNELHDPEFQAARTDAKKLRDKYLRNVNSDFYISSTDLIKTRLYNGQPVILDIDFYYGAWNHRVAVEKGIERNMQHWAQGIVGNPADGSLDEYESQRDPNGHSILLVGYDDSKVVETTVQMKDGSKKTFKYKGVYYFKNSWGTASFGIDFAIDGVKYPGYGMITQEYAHRYGSFFRLIAK